MIAVNTLIQRAYESLTMTGLGEAVEGTMAEAACNELNRLIVQLNNEGFIAMAQKTVLCPAFREIRFKQPFAGEIDNDPRIMWMEPPQCIEAVARKLGSSFVPLTPSNLVQMVRVNPQATASQWTYNTVSEDIPGNNGEQRIVGVLTLDGNPRDKVMVFYNSALRTYKLDETIYLSDLYNELLLAGLCFRLANFHNLSDQKKAETAADFETARTLIKRNNVTQRMLTYGNVGGDWTTGYNNFVNGSNI